VILVDFITRIYHEARHLNFECIYLFQAQKMSHNRKFQDDFSTFRSVLYLLNSHETTLTLPVCATRASKQMKSLAERSSCVPQELRVKM